MERRVTPSRRVTSPTRGPPPSYKQALYLTSLFTQDTPAHFLSYQKLRKVNILLLLNFAGLNFRDFQNIAKLKTRGIIHRCRQSTT